MGVPNPADAPGRPVGPVGPIAPVLHVPSAPRYLSPAPGDGAGTNPAIPAALEVAPLMDPYVVSVNFASAGTSESTVCLFTVAALPPFAGSDSGLFFMKASSVVFVAFQSDCTFCSAFAGAWADWLWAKAAFPKSPLYAVPDVSPSARVSDMTTYADPPHL